MDAWLTSKRIAVCVLAVAVAITLSLFACATSSGNHAGSTASATSKTSSSSSIASSSQVSSASTQTSSASVPTDDDDGDGNLAQPESASLVVDGDPAMYTYEDLCLDVEALKRAYPEWVSVNNAGTTVDGRNLQHLIIGNPEAQNHVLVHAGIHAREYITTQLLMKQVATFLLHARSGDSYGGMTYAQMLNANAIHVIPSINPDGAALSQAGLDGIRDEAVRARLLEIAPLDGSGGSSSYYRNWKANANGVDLNRNFDALWSDFVGTGHPSSERYKGTAPGSEIEAKALIDLTERYRFSRTISYHAMGSVIYWYFGQSGTLYDDTLAFAQAVSNVTGYRLDANYEYLDPAGYKDWAIQAKGIPSLTVEVGWGETPVPPEQFQTIWQQNEHVLETMLLS